MAADHGHFKFYHYDPSLAAAVVFIVLFGFTTGFHIWKLIPTKIWSLEDSALELIGYIGRAMSSQQESGEWTLGPYIIQYSLLLLAPALFAASIYMILARIILLTDGNSHIIIKLRWITKIFVTGDVLSFLVQSSGGGLMSKIESPDDTKMGGDIIVGGLGIQVLVFGCFIVVAAIFNLRIRKVPTTKSTSAVRSIFRIVEYVMGGDGILLQHEYYLYIFNATLMFFVTVLFCVWHPNDSISRNVSLRKGRRDVESQSEECVLEESLQEVRAKR